ncbi:hypothetical protein FBUS_05380 [Fasciolopsis buskii]|uniref:Uncharacterized protein n=1 Tax=Fasciolopsis buskii TaxID=27845 RepID=A0A8E0RXA5_9TREM|nr:hypothetical protein FBUS_05380 [Fasciolopsis buski]
MHFSKQIPLNTAPKSSSQFSCYLPTALVQLLGFMVVKVRWANAKRIVHVVRHDRHVVRNTRDVCSIQMPQGPPTPAFMSLDCSRYCPTVFLLIIPTNFLVVILVFKILYPRQLYRIPYYSQQPK